MPFWYSAMTLNAMVLAPVGSALALLRPSDARSLISLSANKELPAVTGGGPAGIGADSTPAKDDSPAGATEDALASTGAGSLAAASRIF